MPFISLPLSVKLAILGYCVLMWITLIFMRNTSKLNDKFNRSLAFREIKNVGYSDSDANIIVDELDLVK